MEPNKTEKQTANDALISVVIPVYNTRDTLGACVESMLAQTHACFELLLLDDGSTDGSGALCDAYAQKDARVRVLHLDHAGVAAARNRGIDAARGDFIGFVDSDDTAEPAYLARLLAPLLANPEIGVGVCGWTVVRDGRDAPGTARGRGALSSREAILEALDHSCGFHGYLWNKLFRAELFFGEPKLRLDADLAVCEDLLLCIRVFLRGAAAYDGGEPLYRYTYRETGLLHTMDEKRMSEFAARERIAALLKDDPQLYHAAELAHVKAALNLLADAMERGDRTLAKDLKARVDARLPMLLRAHDLPRSERMKLAVRRAFPKRSMRVFRRMQRRRDT